MANAMMQRWVRPWARSCSTILLSRSALALRLADETQALVKRPVPGHVTKGGQRYTGQALLARRADGGSDQLTANALPLLRLHHRNLPDVQAVAAALGNEKAEDVASPDAATQALPPSISSPIRWTGWTGLSASHSVPGTLRNARPPNARQPAASGHQPQRPA